MNQDELRGIIEEALDALSDPPPGKTKRVEGLVTRTGLEENQVQKVIHDLKREWEVLYITPPSTTSEP